MLRFNIQLISGVDIDGKYPVGETVEGKIVNFMNYGIFIELEEGVEGLIKFKGNVSKVIFKLVGGLKSSMGYLGAKTIIKLRKKPNFVKITKAGFYESMVHNIDEVKKDSEF